MKIQLLFFLAILTGCTIIPSQCPAKNLDAFQQNSRLGRGINTPLNTDIQGIRLIKNAGFQALRVPIQWDKHTSIDKPYTIEKKYFEEVDQLLTNAQQVDLNVVLDFHGYRDLVKEPDDNRERFISIWEQIAERYKNRPDSVYYELLNEPSGNLEKQWNSLIERTITAIRRIDPTHTIIVGGIWWSHVKALEKLTLPKDETNLIATFHFYDPMIFTHQGAEWSSKYKTTGVVWPGPPPHPIVPLKGEEGDFWHNYNTLPTEENPAGPKHINDLFDFAQIWSKKHNIPLWLGEFGAYSKADTDSRIRWTKCVREAAEKRGISWAYWEFNAGFGVYDRSTSSWKEGLLNALIPEHQKAQ